MANRVIVKGDIGNALHSVAPDHITTTSNEVFDETQQQYQDELNVKSVRVDSQDFTSEQKAQALSNLGVTIGEASDFTNPDATKRAKVPTIGAILDGANDGVYDVSTRNPSGGPNSDGKFTLEYILSNADTLIPTSWRKGGMSIKFVQSSDNKYVQYFLTKDEWSASEADWQALALVNEVSELGSYIDNPEFIRVYTDNDGKFLWGIHTDGSIDWAEGIPKPIQKELSRLENTLNILTGGNLSSAIESVNEILEYLNGINDDESLFTELNSINTKLSSLEDWRAGIDVETTDSPELINAITDYNGKILAGIKKDGSIYFPHNDMYHYMSNHEFAHCIVDGDNHVLWGIRKDGSVYEYKGNKSNEFWDAIIELQKVLESKASQSDVDALVEDINNNTHQTVSESKEYIAVVVDADGKAIEKTFSDGRKEYPHQQMYDIDMQKEYLQTVIDGNGSLIEAIDNNGKKYLVKPSNQDELLQKQVDAIKENIATVEDRIYTEHIVTDYPSRLPEYGYIDIKTGEYLLNNASAVVTINRGDTDKDVEALVENVTAGDKYILRIGYIDDIDCTNIAYIQFGDGTSMFEDKTYFAKNMIGTVLEVTVPENATKIKLCYNLSNINQSVFDADVKDIVIDNIYLYNKNSNLMYHYQQTEPSLLDKNNGAAYIENLKRWIVYDWTLTQEDIDASPDTDWTDGRGTAQAGIVSKEIKKKCIVECKIPGYIEGHKFALVSFQGSSTLYKKKKGFRVTFYKDNKYKKKEKYKIGDMIELSGYNSKAYVDDETRLREPIVYRIAQMMWESRDFENQYPWNTDYNIAVPATGIIKNFPIKVMVDGTFYGVEFFGEKKDENNYMLDGDESGMMLMFNYNSGLGFSDLATFLSRWEDEMNDEDVWQSGYKTTASNITALTNLFNYYMGNNFSAETVEEMFDKHSWIDYLIMIQVFYLTDNMNNNIMLYSKSDKTKFYVFPYDLNSSLLAYNDDIFVRNPNGADLTLLKKLSNVWWKDIVARYKELRKGVLQLPVFTKVIDDICRGINYSDYKTEMKNWDMPGYPVKILIDTFKMRLSFCDKYFV